MTNLIDSPDHTSQRDHLERLMKEHMQRIGDEFLSREEYYRRYEIELDERGKVAALVENMYDRAG